MEEIGLDRIGLDRIRLDRTIQRRLATILRALQ